MASTDTTQLSQWFEAYGPALVLFARQRLGTERAEDAVQEVFCRLVSLPCPPDNVKSWLYKTVRNEAISRLRAKQRRRKYETRRVAQRPDWFEADPDALIDARTAQVALTALPDEQREIIVLRIWAEMTFQEAAHVIGDSVSTLFSRYRAGLETLRKAMVMSCKTKPD